MKGIYIQFFCAGLYYNQIGTCPRIRSLLIVLQIILLPLITTSYYHVIDLIELFYHVWRLT